MLHCVTVIMRRWQAMWVRVWLTVRKEMRRCKYKCNNEDTTPSPFVCCRSCGCLTLGWRNKNHILYIHSSSAGKSCTALEMPMWKRDKNHWRWAGQCCIHHAGTRNTNMHQFAAENSPQQKNYLLLLQWCWLNYSGQLRKQLSLFC